ncbi:MAG: type II secretion system protein [Candidatus Margulisbacteria bacterium]|nr:type II secretion system protein [Candidatus Margulisiibacteriota bacterium]
MKMKKRSGFSLFELLIALSLMVILSSFVVPNIKKIQNKSNQMTAEVNLRTFQSCVENYFIENNIYPSGSLGAKELFETLKTEELIKTSPINPYTKKAYADSDTKGKITYASSDGEDYTLNLYEADGTTVGLSLNSL